MLRYNTDSAWFSRLLRHPARKRSGSILTTPERARGVMSRKFMSYGRNAVVPVKHAEMV